MSMFPDPPQDPRTDEAGPNLHLMTTASTPATPGPSTPTTVRPLPLAQLKIDDHEDDIDIVPPVRPSSTPFPQADLAEGDIHCLQRWSEGARVDGVAQLIIPSASSSSPLCNLPTEIHECILDHLFGIRASASSRTMGAGQSKVLRGWGTALRHSRRREVAELALVSRKWRHLIQDRLYRHLKIKGTRQSVEQAIVWFHLHPHLCPYGKHIEIWFPVFQQKNPAFDRTLRVPTPDRSASIRSNAPPGGSISTVTYQSPSDNCTLEEIFRFIQLTFGEACILTLEGGDRKKPPMVRHFLNPSYPEPLPVISQIRTLVCKGQWNIMRCNEDFQNIVAALPNLNEWHGLYAKPKSKSYISMAATLPNIPQHLTHLNLCLENDYRREAVSPLFVKKVGIKTHFCAELAKAIPTLEHLAFTGRICRCFFDDTAKLSNPRTSRLKSIDFIVKNICRPTFVWNDGTGITDLPFIQAFESLVLAGIRSLDKLPALEFLRIRFIDLESQLPALNPYFQLQNNQCTGIWSDPIVGTLSRTRPVAAFVEKSETFSGICPSDGQLLTPATFSKTRPLSIKVSTYQSLTGGINIT
ncbi:Uncharacterized protein BP5553_07972 [Venustampulla echinocandica]|uniref:F-box domain-containing protein n=1 Tax=Venustampulla echinocandica TaxID=2656787 RepID=A0A370TFD1_9HELO|nr:Uncharacterized protein BP5553_07972 [Venustampulla echinocandica]RDL33604.1 Uncharacterized protein BP5553_07972 [Venustampulla echinocandica]